MVMTKVTSAPTRTGLGLPLSAIDRSEAAKTVDVRLTVSCEGFGLTSRLETVAVSVIAPTEFAPVWTTIVAVTVVPAGTVPRMASIWPFGDAGLTYPWLSVAETTVTPEGSWSDNIT